MLSIEVQYIPFGMKTKMIRNLWKFAHNFITATCIITQPK